MISLSLSISIPDFSKHPIEIQCPMCKLHSWTTIGEAQRGDSVICRGCHRTIILRDHLGSVKRSFDIIGNKLKNFGK